MSDETFHIVITYTSPDGKEVKFYERVSGHYLIQLMARFQLTIAKLVEVMREEREKEHAERIRTIQSSNDDDIPF